MDRNLFFFIGLVNTCAIITLIVPMEVMRPTAHRRQWISPMMPTHRFLSGKVHYWTDRKCCMTSTLVILNEMPANVCKPMATPISFLTYFFWLCTFSIVAKASAPKCWKPKWNFLHAVNTLSVWVRQIRMVWVNVREIGCASRHHMTLNKSLRVRIWASEARQSISHGNTVAISPVKIHRIMCFAFTI